MIWKSKKLQVLPCSLFVVLVTLSCASPASVTVTETGPGQESFVGEPDDARLVLEEELAEVERLLDSDPSESERLRLERLRGDLEQGLASVGVDGASPEEIDALTGEAAEVAEERNSEIGEYTSRVECQTDPQIRMSSQFTLCVERRTLESAWTIYLSPGYEPIIYGPPSGLASGTVLAGSQHLSTIDDAVDWTDYDLKITGDQAIVTFPDGRRVFVGLAPGLETVPEECDLAGVTVLGTDGDDILSAPEGGSVIAGLGGNDTIEGGNGTNVICGGSGDDSVSGGNGKDTILGGEGDDVLIGGNGKDNLIGGAGHDTADGGKGKDTCSAEEVIDC